MNRKEAIVIGAVLFTAFVSGVFADTLSTSTTKTTLQTTSVDVQIMDSQISLGGARIDNEPANIQSNFTSGFSFSPQRGFVQVNSIILTLVTSGMRGTVNVVLNGHNSGQLSVLADADLTTVGNLSTQGIRVGSNLIELSIPVNTVLVLYEVRLTVEYTFLG